MPSILFVHNGAPGRFAFLAAALRARGWTGALINGATGTDLEGFPSARWRSDPAPPQPLLLRRTVERLQGGEGGVQAARYLKERGFAPDLIVGHPAWGEMLFLDEIFPGVPQIQLGELYYRTRDSNFDFDPEFRDPSLNQRIAHVAANAGLALSYAQATRLIVPTPFQAGTFPAAFQPLIRIIHEGVDTKLAAPRQAVRITLGDGRAFEPGTPIITFVNRRFEPMRGFHIFVRALPRILAALPQAQVMMVGLDDRDTYGASPPEGWRAAMLAEMGSAIDPARVHWPGALSYPQLLSLLSASSAHVYLTYPFVLSWSLLDAMAVGALVIGSDTAPVRDVIENAVNGLLVDFFDITGLADRVIEACRYPARFTALRTAARRTIVERYDRETVCLPAWLAEIEAVTGKV